MADQLFLSIRLRGYTENNMLRHYERLLRHFPYSQLANTGSTVRVSAVSWNEPPVYEDITPDPVDVDAVLAAVKPFLTPDCSLQLETKWDLWQYEDEWKLRPARVMLSSFGPE